MRKFFIAACLLVITGAQAQDKLRYGNVSGFSVSSGSMGSAGQLQTINGARYKQFFAGAGVGIDDYYKLSVPLFLDLRYQVLRKPATPFVYADYGVNLPWSRGEQTEWSKSEMSSGRYFDAGLGYQLPVNKNLQVQFSIGFSQKRLEETVQQMGWVIDIMPGTGSAGWTNPESRTYTLSRYVLRAAVVF